MTSLTTTPATLAEPPSHGGSQLLMIMTSAILVSIAAIVGFSLLGSWWLLPFVVLGITALTIGVIAAVLRLIADDDLVAPRPPERAPRELVTAAKPSTRPALGL